MKSFVLKMNMTQFAKPRKIPHFQKLTFLYHCYLIAFYHDDKLDTFLNQARAGRRPARAWFLKIDPVRFVCMRACVCVRARGY